MESSHLVIFSTSGKFITKFNVLRCISLSETPFWTGASLLILFMERKIRFQPFKEICLWTQELNHLRRRH